MRKNLLLTCLLALVATFAMAQTAQWPIVLTTADGLPGSKVVRNYAYQSKKFELDEAVSTLRFTVIRTNTTDGLTENNFDGYSSGWGTGFPFFTMSELRIYDGSGNKIDYVATGNAVATNDGGGVEALNDNNEGTYLHTVYSRGSLPHAYHYIELELAEPVSSFSFNWNTRSDYHKNLITYMGITPGTEFFPYPEQEFKLGEQVKNVEELAAEGALFVLRSNGDGNYFYEGFDRTENVKGEIFMHAPCGGAETASAASLVYLTPDPQVENGYKVAWLNSGHYMIKQELNPGWFNWTNYEPNAGTVTFAPCDTLEGAFVLSMNDNGYLISYDALGKMSLVGNNDESKGNRSRPNFYNWTIFNASINGASIKGELQAAIDEADKRIAAIGGKVENDEGEYDALVEALEEARTTVADPEVSAASIITSKRNLNLLTAAYAAVGIWAYVDSIDVISAAVEEGDIVVTSAPDWIEGAYSEAAFDNLSTVAEEVMIVIDNYQSLADIDVAIDAIYSAIDAFWASKVANVKNLPFRIGTTEDGLPGTLQSYGGYKWESPMYNLTEEVDAIRLTFFKTNNNAVYSGTSYVFATFAEVEFYDATGNKIALTAENFESNAIMTQEGGSGDWAGYAALCDGNTDTHAHGTWGSGQVESYDAAPDYQYLEITFPEAISSFKYVQYGRKNGVNTPTDFVVSKAGESYTPDDIDLPDFYNTKLGEKVTDASQITDDGFYALVGLINCAPEGDGTGFEKFYSSNVVYGTKVGAPTLFSIRKTGDADGTFYIQSIADGKYWSSEIDDDGWGAGTITSVKADAGKFNIVATPRAEFGLQDFPNTFQVYMYNDTVKRNDAPYPYIVAQDWGSNVGYFSLDSLVNNDWDGEGEWYIYKASMDNPHCYWLKSFVAAAEAMNLQVGPDPGFYSEASAGEFAKALTKAQNALAANNDAVAKEAIPDLEAAIAVADVAVTNPVIAGVYVFEAAYRDAFIASTGTSKYMCTYYNDFEAGSPNCISELSLWWADAPAETNLKALHDRYKFELISATNSDKVQIWLEDEIIDSVQAANAYFIRSIEANQYAGTSVDGNRSQDIGLTVDPEEPYIIRSQGSYVFDFWHPSHANCSLHLEGNSGGTGAGGDVVYWAGTDKASQWYLRYIGDITSINNGTVAEGDEVVSTTYYTVGGAAIAAPVKGINVVKKVYANGVVKTEKVYVK